VYYYRTVRDFKNATRAFSCRGVIFPANAGMFVPPLRIRHTISEDVNRSPTVVLLERRRRTHTT